MQLLDSRLALVFILLVLGLGFIVLLFKIIKCENFTFNYKCNTKN